MRRWSSAAAAVLWLAACSGGPVPQTGGPGGFAPARVRAAGFTLQGQLFVGASALIDRFDAWDASPAAQIAGSKTQLERLTSVSTTKAGGAIMTDGSKQGKIQVYAPGANGNVGPVQTVIGPETGLVRPTSIATDSQGAMYVGSLNSVLVFGAKSKGNVIPHRVLVVSKKVSDLVEGVLVYKDWLYVSVWSQPDFIAVYKSGLTSDTKLVGVLEGGNVKSSHPQGMAVDSKGNLYVAERTLPGVNVYPTGTFGNVKPITTIGPTLFAMPASLAVDENDNLYVLDVNARHTLYVFGPNAKAATQPLAQIAAPDKGTSLAYHP